MTEINYWPLRRKHNEIRILEFQPGPNEDAPLRCTMQHVELKKASYDALSYVWGQQQTDKSLVEITYKRKLRHLLSGEGDVPTVQTIEIGSNLAAALRCLRHSNRTVSLWVDAICIDQREEKNEKVDELHDEDDKIVYDDEYGDVSQDEKSWQLCLMKSIYVSANNVVAWLGPPDPIRSLYSSQIPTTFQLADKIWMKARSIVSLQHQARLEDLSDEKWLEVCFALRDTTENTHTQEHVKNWPGLGKAVRESVTSDQWLMSRLGAFRALAQSNYFSRVWILQETGRARTLTFQYAQQKCSGRAVLLALSVVSALETSAAPTLDTRFLGCLTARLTCIQRRTFQDVLEVAYFEPPPLRNATVLSDLIFARIGLAQETPDFRINIKNSPAAVFTLVSCYLLSRGFLSLLLSFKPYPWQIPFPDKLSPDKLPSWVYDWTSKTPDIFNEYRASADSSQKAAFYSHPQAKFGRVMALRGIEIGRVSSVGRRFYDTVLAAGLSQVSVADGTLANEPTTMPSGKKAAISTRIKQLYGELGFPVADSDVEQVFEHEQIFPLAGFLCWWLMWTGPLRRLINASRSARNPSTANDVSELLLRVGYLGESRPELAALIDINGWNRLLRSSDAEYGINLAECLFRSAWGTRPAMLNTQGRLGYFPEATQVQDRVVIFHGVKAPLVIREAPIPGTYKIIGPTHVCGAMSGALMDDHTPQTCEYRLV